MKLLRLPLLVLFVLIVPCSNLTVSAATVTAPYTDNFQSSSAGSSPADWTNTGTATWTIGNNGTTFGGTNYYQSTTTTAQGAFASLLQFTNLTSNFTLTSTFQLNDRAVSSIVPPGTQQERIGLAALSTAGLGSAYVADIQGNSGSMRIVSLGTNSDFSTPGALSLAGLLLNTSYTMTLTGAYSGSTLNLSYSVTDGVTTQTVTATDPTPYTGQFFGFRNNLGASNTDGFGIRFANFQAVPEPSVITLLVCSLLAAGCLMRRNAGTVKL